MRALAGDKPAVAMLLDFSTRELAAIAMLLWAFCPLALIMDLHAYPVTSVQSNTTPSMFLLRVSIIS